MQPSFAGQSVHAIAVRGDRARRRSAAYLRVARHAPAVAAVACLASALSPVLGGPRVLGPILLAVGVVVAGVSIVAARFLPRGLHDRAVAELDRAAGLEGSLRSAHWFVGHTPAAADVGPSGSWIASHLEDAASRAGRVDWARVFHLSSRRWSWAFTLSCVLLTAGLSVRPLPRLVRRTIEPTAAATVSASPPAAAPSLAPQILEGIKAMRSGRPPSEAQLSAIGQALQTARHDPAARKRIEAEVNGSDAKGAEAQRSAPSDNDGAAWSDDYHNGFEMSDLDWAYQEAMARGRSEPAAKAEPGGEVTAAPPGKREPAAKGKQGEPASAGELTGSPVEGDTRGRPADFASLLRGTQHSTGKASAEDQAKDAGRVARLTAALRTEVVHASSQITLPDLDRPAARRATNASQAPVVGPDPSKQVRYDRSRASQPPAVPEARRPLLRGYFLRPAEPMPAVKRP
ncbi:MAG: hypothetical protein ABIX28_14185 [Vicinamibacterales bacterium]